MKKIAIVPQVNAFNKSVSFAIFDDGNCPGMATSIEFTTVDDYAETTPLFETSLEMTQQLMNDLWRCGFRPTNQVGYEGQLEAVKNHLADMRTLVFDLDKKEG